MYFLYSLLLNREFSIELAKKKLLLSLTASSDDKFRQNVLCQHHAQSVSRNIHGFSSYVFLPGKSIWCAEPLNLLRRQMAWNVKIFYPKKESLNDALVKVFISIKILEEIIIVILDVGCNNWAWVVPIDIKYAHRLHDAARILIAPTPVTSPVLGQPNWPVLTR